MYPICCLTDWWSAAVPVYQERCRCCFWFCSFNSVRINKYSKSWCMLRWTAKCSVAHNAFLWFLVYIACHAQVPRAGMSKVQLNSHLQPWVIFYIPCGFCQKCIIYGLPVLYSAIYTVQQKLFVSHCFWKLFDLKSWEKSWVWSVMFIKDTLTNNHLFNGTIKQCHHCYYIF